MAATPSPYGRRNTSTTPARPSSKLVRDGSAGPGQFASSSARPPLPRRVSTSAVGFGSPLSTPPTPNSTASASPLHRASFSRPTSKRYSLPTALPSPALSSFASSLVDDQVTDVGDDVESSFWTSQHPLSSGGRPLTEIPSEEGSEDMITEVSDVDADMRLALDRVAALHSSKLTDYRRLLSAATSQAAQHRLSQSAHGPAHHPPDGSSSNLSLDSLSDFVHNLSKSQRMQALDIVLQACHGSDIWVMQRAIERYIKSTRDIVGTLPSPLAVRILLHLDAPQLLDCRRVSKRWNALLTDPAEPSSSELWQVQCERLTRGDAVKPQPKQEGAWLELYQGLHHLARNWQQGLAQEIVLLRGHTSHVTALKKHGDTLITGSYDKTLRIFNLRSAKCVKTISCQSSISCLDYLPEHHVVVAGCHAIGTVFVISCTTGETLATLSGHNKGIKSVVVSDKYIISAGMDKAIVVWSLETGTRIVRFGSQTNLSLGFSLFGDLLCAVQVDGLLRTFDIKKRQSIAQFRPHELFEGFPSLAAHYRSIATGTQTNAFMWFAATGRYMTIATRDHLLYFRWYEDRRGAPDLSRAPELLSFIVTDQSTNDLTVGVADPDQGRVLTSTRFAARTAASEHRIYIGHFARDRAQSAGLMPIEGAWARLQDADGLDLQSSAMNPMCLAIDRERLVVGTTSGLIYTVDFLGVKSD